MWFNGPMKVSEAAPPVATMPLPTSRPAVAVTIAAMPANRRVGLIRYSSLRQKILRLKYERRAKRDWRQILS